MKPLIDADSILYQVGFASQEIIDEQVIPKSWEYTCDLLEKVVNLICEEAEGTEAPLLFLSNTPRINKLLNKQRKREEQPLKDYVDNFRKEVAKGITVGDNDAKDYKGTRVADKPHHFYNLLSYVLASYPTYIGEDDLEADDHLCIYQYNRWRQGLKDTIICSLDKDLRQCPGVHYTWAVGERPSVGPYEVDELGVLEHINKNEKDTKGRVKPPKIFGTGYKLLYYQMLVGDKADNVNGIKGLGPVFAYNLLKDAVSPRECYELVAEKYVQAWGDRWKEKMRQQADLLFMVREVDEQGEKIKWMPPKKSL